MHLPYVMETEKDTHVNTAATLHLLIFDPYNMEKNQAFFPIVILSVQCVGPSVVISIIMSVWRSMVWQRSRVTPF